VLLAFASHAVGLQPAHQRAHKIALAYRGTFAGVQQGLVQVVAEQIRIELIGKAGELFGVGRRGDAGYSVGEYKKGGFQMRQSVRVCQSAGKPMASALGGCCSISTHMRFFQVWLGLMRSSRQVSKASVL